MKIVNCFILILAAVCAAAVYARADVRFRVRHTEGGRASEVVKYIKGKRQRDEFRGVRGRGGKLINTAFIRECDRRRLLWLDETNKVYSVHQLDFRSNDEAFAYYAEQAAQPDSPYAKVLEQARAQREKLPATIIATTTVIDTGERREMFGYAARRIKTVTMWESAPAKACPLEDARFETDGWYVDLLYGLDCSANISGQTALASPPNAPLPPGRCGERIAKDKYRFESKLVGSARFGFPLLLTQAMFDGTRRTSVLTSEVLELSTEELSESLFELPAGFREIYVKQTKK